MFFLLYIRSIFLQYYAFHYRKKINFATLLYQTLILMKILLPKVQIIQTLLLWVGCLMFCVGMNSCARSEDTFHIGVSQCSSDDWREQQNMEMEHELLLHDNVTMELRSAKDNREQQLKDIEYFLDQKVDLLVVSPMEAEAFTDILSRAVKQNIPVVLFDRKTSGDSYTSFIGGNNVEIGTYLAEYVITQLPKGGKILEFTGSMDSSPAVLRHEGLLKGLKGHPEITICASVDGQWNASVAASKTDSLLKLYPDADLIVAHNDRMAISVKEKIDALYPGNHMRAIGVDGIYNVGLKAITEGKLDASVTYPTGGEFIIQTAVRILQEEEYQRDNILETYVISNKEDAELSRAFLRGIDREVEKVKKLKDKVDYFWRLNNLETTLLYVLLALLLVTLGLFVALFRSYQFKKKVNERLKNQQITLVKQRDDLLKLTHELEQATLAKLMFFTNISHDFRTPLTLISAPIERVLQKENLAQEEHKLLKMAHRNVGVLLRLVNQILDFRKTESDKMELHLKVVDLKKILQDWHDSFLSMADKKEISLVFQAQDGDYLNRVDVNKLERIFYNLVGNAFKYTPKGGTISILLSQDNQQMVIKVCDTGTGIDEKHIQRIFENYYQVDSANHEGTGLGLALAKSFVELHGGSIRGENQTEGSGSVFTISLPMRDTDGQLEDKDYNYRLNPEAESPEIEEEDAVEQLTVTEDEPKPIVLVIDDNADIRVFLYTLLKSKYRIIRAKNGLEGLQKATETIPDVIICDVMMPVMDGLECCQKLKTGAATSHIPVLMLTSCSLDEQRVKGLEEGADVYLAKPFNSQVLMAQIESLLKNHIRVKDFYQASLPPVEQIPGEIEKKAQEEETRLSKYDKNFIEKIQQLIANHLSDSTYSVERMASDVCLSRTQLFRKCKSLVGESPVELLRNTRLKAAQQLLVQGEGPISKVAELVGFTDPSYFTKCYKGYFGSTPRTEQQETAK